MKHEFTVDKLPVYHYAHTFIPSLFIPKVAHREEMYNFTVNSFGVIPPRALCGAPLWRLRGPVGLPFSSRRLIFPGGGPLRSGLVAVRRSGLSRRRGLSPPPRSIPLHTAGGTPAREYGPEAGTEIDKWMD